MRWYGIDLLEVGTPALSWRRLRNLLQRLPREAATVRAEHGPEVEWGPLEHLLASILDALNAANWQRSSGGKKQPPRPQPTWRPGQRRQRRARAEVSGQQLATKLRQLYQRDEQRKRAEVVGDG